MRMEQHAELTVPTVRTTCKYTRKATPAPEQALAFVLRRCRELYPAGLDERRDAWRNRGGRSTLAGQRPQLPDSTPHSTAVRPDDREVHAQVLFAGLVRRSCSQVVQAVLTRLDGVFQAVFRRIQSGEMPGYPRFQGSNRYHSFTYQQVGKGASLENGFLVLCCGAVFWSSVLELSHIGRVAVRWSRPQPRATATNHSHEPHPRAGTPKTGTISRDADGWYVGVAGADVPREPLPATGRETGRDGGIVGIESWASCATLARWPAAAHPALGAHSRASFADGPTHGSPSEARVASAARKGASAARKR
jgi:putative transposase